MSSSPPSVTRSWLAYYRELIATWAKKADSIQDVEDATQDVMVTMLNSNEAAIREPRAYLHRSVYHGLTAQYRERRAAPTVSLHELAEDEHPACDDADSHARAAQLSDALLVALRELPLQHQQVFAWHRLEGWTMPEIAGEMGLSVSTVEKYLTKAMRHIHSRLQHFSR
jgi:RNA polymerase sigma factor (sigma-70 family)